MLALEGVPRFAVFIHVDADDGVQVANLGLHLLYLALESLNGGLELADGVAHKIRPGEVVAFRRAANEWQGKRGQGNGMCGPGDVDWMHWLALWEVF